MHRVYRVKAGSSKLSNSKKQGVTGNPVSGFTGWLQGRNREGAGYLQGKIGFFEAFEPLKSHKPQAISGKLYRVFRSYYRIPGTRLQGNTG